jgi:hypothetical protein
MEFIWKTCKYQGKEKIINLYETVSRFKIFPPKTVYQ